MAWTGHVAQEIVYFIDKAVYLDDIPLTKYELF